ncbi:hypothetical protein G5B30_13155 [Sphingobacterium sp. SGG-5]|uniref:heparin lyase I family protein n=1 Tax=Sphingobacterium sp. SGG-5 TaxID=2710881 RepID=UPI0013EA8AB0|nr:heparin lyase I family protein [Sphingobacterium sp. SGG-5]NGM62859.1 hypothetical protein [Sphingobacterium sp. SGG-5]
MENRIKNYLLAICILLAIACCGKKEVASPPTDKKEGTKTWLPKDENPVNDTILNVDYESGTLNSGIVGIRGTVAPGADAAYIISPSRNSTRGIAHKVTLGEADYYSAEAYRSEADALEYLPALFFPGMERRYEFSVYLRDWEPWNTVDTPYGDNIFQLKVSGGDPVPVRLLTKRHAITVRFGPAGNGIVISDFRPNINRWIDFRIDVKWTTDNTGYFKIYTKYEDETAYVLRFQQDNLVTFTGTQLNNGQKGYIKWGVYREAGKDDEGNVILTDNVLTRIAYHDNIRIIKLDD